MPRVFALCLFSILTPAVFAADGANLKIVWDKDWLTITGANVTGGEVRVHYLEAYCRPGSTDREWAQTTIGHKTSLVEASSDGKVIKLRCAVKDGIVVDHVITAGADEIDFKVIAHNPTDKASDAHWAQPCIQVPKFTAADQNSYVKKCFIFIDGKPTHMPFEPWAMKARYIPGQVWCPKNVNRDDVNPRPLSSVVPSNGLIGVYSSDDKKILATAWEPYQELFQGVGVCIHSDFRIGGLKPGETKTIRGKIYIVDADMGALVKRYEKDFPEQAANAK
ncbi:MAG TPA: hypothetical protein VKX17_20680 [Planctomycetota bacterium]|nr:hypothetical protein [Planctomycetota bacterium]